MHTPLLNVQLETRSEIDDTHVFGHVFWRRTFALFARNPFRNRRKSRFWARVLASYLCIIQSKPVAKINEYHVFEHVFWRRTYTYICRETHSKINENHDFEHVFWRRTSVRLARSPFKNHRKTCVLARVLASYLDTFGSKPVQKSSTISDYHVFWHVFWHRIYIRLARNPFKNHRKSRVLARVLTSYLYTFGSKPVPVARKICAYPQKTDWG